MTTKEADLKIILLGDTAVGKSKLMERFLMDKYDPRQDSTYALTFFPYETNIDGKKVHIEFWDTAGQERFQSMHPSYYYRAHACILVFDCTRKITYMNLNGWYQELRKYRPNVPVIVVCNKVDVDPEVTRKTFSFPKKRGLEMCYVSAADGSNVVALFEKAIKQAQEYKDNPGEDFLENVMETIKYFDLKEKVEVPLEC